MAGDELALGRRERQLLEILFRLGKATATQVRAELPDPPTNSAVRGMLRALESKGYIAHELCRHSARPQYLYQPTTRRSVAATSALRKVVRTFFAGSAEKAAVTLLQISDLKLSPEETERIHKMIARARLAGR